MPTGSLAAVKRPTVHLPFDFDGWWNDVAEAVRAQLICRRLSPESREIVQAEHRDQERHPDRIGAVEEEALHRRQIEPEQPDPQQHHRQRAVVAALIRGAENSARA